MNRRRPSREQLLALAAGELSETEAAAVEAALADDAEARALVERYRTVRSLVQADDSEAPPQRTLARARAIFDPAQLPRPQRWFDRLEQVIASLIFDSRSEPAPAGYRGTAEGFQATYETDAVQIDLEAAPADSGTVPGGGRRWQVMGQISTEQPVADVSVAMIVAGTDRAEAEASADEHGVFEIEVPPQRYDVYVRVGSQALVVPDVDLT